ncbi:MAG: Hsp70 family protein [Candidatus Lernaella stagnicola]|nr:Hsp70 family protein [Candidatus Lernaella stagnicola]
MDIGIDLGTTFSVLSVDGRVTLSEGYPKGFYLAECDVTVIPTPEAELTFPSVVWEAPENRGVFIVGYGALEQAGAENAPVMFAKRRIGSDEAIPLNDRSISARDASREILKYLKACAEQALGRPVERAVITHPAYFDRIQVEETRQAAIEAGFDMSLPDQMVMEPVAAALAYCRFDKRDPLHVLTYDLGGGTFDVTYLRREGGVISMKAFDGDHLLGGYNFDRELVHWLRQRLQRQEREVLFDEDNAADRGRLSQLLRLMEQVKIRLAEAPDDQTPIDVRSPNLLVDTAGRRVQVLERITRAEFVELIAPHIERTVECCRRTLEKGDVDSERLDEVLLVGGSSYGPWVQEALQAAFPAVSPKLFFPDLCVSAGAAIHAAAILPARVDRESFQLDLDVPSRSIIREVDIGGRVSAKDGTPDPAGWRATLQLPGGGAMEVALSVEGEFTFADVELLPEQKNHFAVAVLDEGGGALIEHEFDVVHAPDSTDATDVTSVLPKPLFLETLDGMVPLAAEGVTLPARCNVSLTRDTSHRNLTIRIFQEGFPVGAIGVEDIPTEGGRGSKVHLTVSVDEKFRVIGTAEIVSPAGKSIKTAEVFVKFDITGVPAVAQLQEELAALRRRVAELQEKVAEQTEIDAEKRDRIAQLLAIAEHLLEQQPLERQEVWAVIRRLELELRPPENELKPTKQEFLDTVADCRDRIAFLHRRAEETLAGSEGSEDARAKAEASLQRAERYGAVLEQYARAGLAAHAAKDRRRWAAVGEAVDNLRSQIRERSSAKKPSSGLLKMWALEKVEQQKNVVEEKYNRMQSEGRLDEWDSNFKVLAKALMDLERDIMALSDDLPSDQMRSALATLLLENMDKIRLATERIGIEVRK